MPALSALLLTFSFPFSLLFFHAGSQTAAVVYMVYPIHQALPKMWQVRSLYAAYTPGPRGGVLSCAERTSQGKDFELILAVTRRLYCVEWTQYSIRPKQSAICN